MIITLLYSSPTLSAVSSRWKKEWILHSSRKCQLYVTIHISIAWWTSRASYSKNGLREETWTQQNTTSNQILNTTSNPILKRAKGFSWLLLRSTIKWQVIMTNKDPRYSSMSKKINQLGHLLLLKKGIIAGLSLKEQWTRLNLRQQARIPSPRIQQRIPSAILNGGRHSDASVSIFD